MIGYQRWPFRPDVARLDWIIVLLVVIVLLLAVLVVEEWPGG